MTLLLLHGLGQTPDAWVPVLRELEREAVCPDLFAPLRSGSAEYPRLYKAFAGSCGKLAEPLHLCGLSLGGILALQYAAEHPERVGSLVLIGTQYAMPRTALKVQNLMFRLMPAGAFRQMGLSKAEAIGLAGSMLDLDFRGDLGKIVCPALVLCGERDRANRKAALGLRENLPRAELRWIAGAGHEVNVDAPAELGKALRTFYRDIGAAQQAEAGSCR